eukprot:985811-Amphidinium_carterae.1
MEGAPFVAMPCHVFLGVDSTFFDVYPLISSDTMLGTSSRTEYAKRSGNEPRPSAACVDACVAAPKQAWLPRGECQRADGSISRQGSSPRARQADVDKNGCSAVHWAAYKGDLTSLKLLDYFGAEIVRKVSSPTLESRSR